LQAVRGEIRQWQILMPPPAPGETQEVKEPRLPDARIEGIDLPDAQSHILTIRLKETSGEPLRVVLQTRRPWGKARVGIGPYPVLGTWRQWGTIRINAPTDYRVRYHLHGDVNQREVTEGLRPENTVAEFNYWNVPVPVPPNRSWTPALELAVEPFKGVVEARVEHGLVLNDHGWRLNSKINVKPIHTRLEGIEVQVGPGYQLDRETGAMPSDLIDSVEIKDLSNGRRALQIKFFREQTQPFALSLPATYTQAAGPLKAILELPVPMQTLDRGGLVSVTLPEGLELLPPSFGLENFPHGERQHTWRYERFPTRLDLEWQAYRPELAVDGTADITLAGRQAQVRHRLHLQYPLGRPVSIGLKIPAELKGSIRLDGGTLASDGTVSLTTAGPKEHVLTVTYVFPLPTTSDDEPALPENWFEEHSVRPAPARRISIPLVQVVQASRMEIRARIWCDANVISTLAQGPWEERPTENVPEMDTMPALVLASTDREAPLVLGIIEAPSNLLAALVIGRGLIQAAVEEGGNQSYRIRFLVSRLSARQLDVDFPLPIASLNPEFYLGGKKVGRWQSVDSLDAAGEGSKRARLEIEPDLYLKPMILEIRYQVAQGSVNWSRAGFTWLQPPQLREAAILGQVRWRINVPEGWVPLIQDDGYSLGQRWIWQGGLCVPQPTVTSVDLDRWLETGTSESTSTTFRSQADREPDLVCWRADLQAVPLLYFPQPVWLLLCSGALMMVGVIAQCALQRRGRYGLLLALAVLMVILGGWWWPGAIVSVFYGCEPGLAVLGAVLIGRWGLHLGQRRRLKYLPSFTRRQPTVLPARKDSAGRSGREPSTVDAPLQRDSSAKQVAERAVG
jgi:hypothetical protein